MAGMIFPDSTSTVKISRSLLFHFVTNVLSVCPTCLGFIKPHTMRAMYGKPLYDVPVCRIDPCSVHAYQNLAVPDRGLGNVFEIEDIGGPNLSWTIALMTPQELQTR